MSSSSSSASTPRDGATAHLTALPALLVLVLALSGCGGDGDRASRELPEAPEQLEISSPSELPVDASCDGAGEHPGLAIRGTPPETRSFAIVMEDNDADRYVHWTVWDLPPSQRSFRAGEELPVREGKTTGGDTGYEAACPPEDDGAHDYAIAVYALEEPELDLDEGAAPDEVYDAIEDAAVARGTRHMSYARQP